MQETPTQDPRLLAIDESALIHRLLKSHLREERLEIHNATDADQGLRLAQALLPDVILLDIDMPNFDGFTILRHLKADSRTHDVPVLILSGSDEIETKVRGFEMGAMDWISKPFEMAELKARIRSAVRIRTLVKMLAQRAQLDAVTGLWNRAYFDQRLEQEVADATRYAVPLSLIICDLDRFKNINDAHGHQFGDHVLEEFARILDTCRLGDIACRYGGEEFAIIAPHTNATGTAILADRYRDALQSLRWQDHEGIEVTASFGVTDLERAADATTKSLIRSADEAMYAAKETGRNRVAIAPAHHRMHHLVR